MTTELEELTQSVAMNLATKGYLNAPKKRRPQTHWESLMVREFANKRYLNYLKWFRHEVGPYNPNDPVQKYSQLRRFCDLIIDVNDTLLIVEAKMKPSAGAISQLQTYMHLVKETPDLEYYADKPVVGMILTTWEDAAIKKVANQWGMLYEVYVPSFFDEWQKVMIERYKKNEVPVQ